LPTQICITAAAEFVWERQLRSMRRGRGGKKMGGAEERERGRCVLKQQPKQVFGSAVAAAVRIKSYFKAFG